MNERRIEERAEFANGIKTEWEPSLTPTGKQRTIEEREARAYVVALNRHSKAIGSSLRYRSVAAD